MKIRHPQIYLAVLAVWPLLAGCNKSAPESSADSSTIKVGEFASLTGSEATFGQSSHKGTQLAVDDLNAAGGGTPVPNTTNYAYIKKYVIGSPADNQGKGAEQAAYCNTIVLRLAEVYLIYAEAVLGNSASTTDASALQYFNAVRTRAGVPTLSSLAFADIFQEKRIELAIEGNEWYDILRWYYFDPASAEAYVAAQDRGITYTLTWNGTSYAPRQYTFTSSGEKFSFNASSVYLPFPEAEMVAAPSLADPPVPFNFSVLPNY